MKGFWLGAPLLCLLALPFVALVLASDPESIAAGLRHPRFWPALSVSARTSAAALAIVVAAGTPLAAWLSRSPPVWTRPVELVLYLGLVTPPAVTGVALLLALGRNGVLGGPLAAIGVRLPFSPAAVVIAQIVVSAPIYVQLAASAFRQVRPEQMMAARSLGASPISAELRVALPIALPGLIGAAALAWARALGELGATLLFAGSRPGVTETLPLAILTALESDLGLAVALALALAAAALAALVVLLAAPSALRRLFG